MTRSSKEVMELYENNIDLVHYVINRDIKPHASDYDDYYQEGCIGLYLAAKRFDPDRGISFSTYAHSMIKGMCCTYRNSKIDMIRIPREMLSVINKLNSCAQKNGYSCIDEITEEDCEKIGITKDKYDKAVMALTRKNPDSLDRNIDENDDIVMYDVIENEYDFTGSSETYIIIKNFLEKTKKVNPVKCRIYEDYILSILSGDMKSKAEIARTRKCSQMFVSKVIKEYNKMLQQEFAN